MDSKLSTEALKQEKLKLEIDYLRLQILNLQSADEYLELKKQKIRLEIADFERTSVITNSSGERASAPPTFTNMEYNDPFFNSSNVFFVNK